MSGLSSKHIIDYALGDCLDYRPFEFIKDAWKNQVRYRQIIKMCYKGFSASGVQSLHNSQKEVAMYEWRTMEAERRVLAAAKRECGQTVVDASLVRMLFTYWHCGGRMAKVDVFVKKDSDLPPSDENRRRGRPVAVCTHPTCNHAVMLGRG